MMSFTPYVNLILQASELSALQTQACTIYHLLYPCMAEYIVYYLFKH